MIISISSNGMNKGKDLVGKIIQWIKSPVDQQEGWKFNINDDYNVGDWETKKFAGVPNEAYKLITGVDFHELSREDKEKEREGFRSFCEVLKRWNNSDIWVNTLMRDYITTPHRWDDWTKETPGESYPNWIITDLRFPNEYKAIQKEEHLHIHLERFQVGDLVIFNNSSVGRVYKINQLSEKGCELTYIDGNYQTNAYYSEFSVVKNDTHKSENTDLLKESFDENVVYLYNVGSVEELVEKVKVILLNNKIIKK